MVPRRAVLAGAAAAALLALTACEPLDATGQPAGKNATTKKPAGKVVVKYETKSGGTTTSRRSVTVRSGSVARVTSSGSGRVSCRIVLNGRTVVSKSGSGAVTCATHVSR
jgi:hypothetical protein